MPTEIYQNFEWDSKKRETNFIKHGFDFVDAIILFDGIVMDKIAEREVLGERRYLAIGCVQNIVTAVVYVNRNGGRRIISMRKAKRYERENYVEFLTRVKDRLEKN